MLSKMFLIKCCLFLTFLTQITPLTEEQKSYFPHFWQKKFPTDQALDMAIKLFNSEVENNKLYDIVKSELDVPYGPLPRQKYDIYNTDLPADSPIIFAVHGGYWIVEDAKKSGFITIYKVPHQHNIKIFTIDYDLCPNVTVKEIISEVKTAFLQCLDYAKKHKSKGIYLLGHSVGAHLVATLFSNFITTLPADDQNLVRAVFLFCGLYDIIPIVQLPINDKIQLTNETAKEISPQFMQLTSPNHTEFHVIVAEYDGPAFIQQGKTFNDKLQSDGLKSQYHFINDADHFYIIDEIKNENSNITKLILGTVADNRAN